MIQRAKNTPAKKEMQETRVRSLSREFPLEEETAIHSIIPAWEIPWTEKPGGLHSTGLQRAKCLPLPSTKQTQPLGAWLTPPKESLHSFSTPLSAHFFKGELDVAFKFPLKSPCKMAILSPLTSAELRAAASMEFDHYPEEAPFCCHPGAWTPQAPAWGTPWTGHTLSRVVPFPRT